MSLTSLPLSGRPCEHASASSRASRHTRRFLSQASVVVAAARRSTLASASASAVQSAELYRTDAFFYGRFEARVQFAPGEGVVSSFFLWKDGSSSTTSWNELDFEKVKAACQLQTNIWSGTGTAKSADPVDQRPISAADTIPTLRVDAGLHRLVRRWDAASSGDGQRRGRVHAERRPGHGDPLQRLGRQLIVRGGPRPFHPAGERIHRLGSVLLVRERDVPAAVARRLRRDDHPHWMGGRELGIALQPLDPQPGQRELRERRGGAVDDCRRRDRLHGYASR